jgi:hypothetical protein
VTRPFRLSRRSEDRIAVAPRRPLPSRLPGVPLDQASVARAFQTLTPAEQDLLRAEAERLAALMQGRQFGEVSALELLAALGRWLNAHRPPGRTPPAPAGAAPPPAPETFTTLIVSVRE